MSDDVTQKNILNGLAEGMEKNADNIAREEQLIRDAIQPLWRIVPGHTLVTGTKLNIDLKILWRYFYVGKYW